VGLLVKWDTPTSSNIFLICLQNTRLNSLHEKGEKGQGENDLTPYVPLSASREGDEKEGQTIVSL
jgi:hypothetical protein